MSDTASGIILRPGDGRDLGEVMATMEDAFEPVFGEAWTRAQCHAILCVPGVWLVLARDGARPAGFALTRIVLDEAELLLLAVRNDARRRGIAAALVGAVGEGARARGAAKLHLEVRDGNGAIHLYHRLGFVDVGRRPDYYRGRDGATFDALTLALDLHHDETSQ